MTDKPDTSAEAVERALNSWPLVAYRGFGDPQQDPRCAFAASTLRALQAERDAARAELVEQMEREAGRQKEILAALAALPAPPAADTKEPK